MVNMEFINWS